MSEPEIAYRWYDTPIRLLTRRAPRVLARAIIRAHRSLAGHRLASIDLEDGLRLAVSPQDACGHELFYYGAFEPAEVACWRELLDGLEGATVVDVGANIGLYSLLAAARPTVHRVLAFEPSPKVAAMLRVNVALNPRLAAQVVVHEVALASSDGALQFYPSEAAHNFGTGSVVPLHEHAAIVVKSRALDSVLRESEIDRVDLIKMDVEGAELAVLQGMSRTLTSVGPPRLLIEVHPTPLATLGGSPDQLFALLRHLGYRLTLLSAEGERISVSEPPASLSTFHIVAEPDRESNAGRDLRHS